MVLKLIIVSVILVAIIVLILAIKLLIDPKAEFTAHSCALEDGSTDINGICARCRLKDPDNCPENKENKKST
jgi:hypothetical protein